MTSSRREPSLRAQARAHYLQAGQAEKLGLPTSPELPAADPPVPDAAGPEAAADAPAAPSLSERARALYEDSVVPVREIARLCGVTERTIYKYAHKLAWSPRVTRLAGDGKPTAAGRAGRGAGGRFIPLAHADRPHAHGLKALDPDGARLAADACALAGASSQAAEAQALEAAQARAARQALEREARAQERMMELLTGALVDIARLRAERRGRLTPRAQALALRLEHAIVDQMEQL